jgi:hypothetical protein
MLMAENAFLIFFVEEHHHQSGDKTIFFFLCSKVASLGRLLLGSEQGDDVTCRVEGTLIKKKIKFISYVRKFRVEQLQSHI